MSYNVAISKIPMPDRIKALPVSETGYPIPWFVVWLDEDGKRAAPGTGKPDLRIVDTPKIAEAFNRKKCWICGGQLGSFLAFTIGPMCAINRVTSEPPAHAECAAYAVRACPFLTRPKMIRNEKERPVSYKPDGMIERNPGVILIWTTRAYKAFRSDGGGVLFRIFDPVMVTWYREGRSATRAEVIEAIEAGIPFLKERCTPEQLVDIPMFLEKAKRYYPVEPAESGPEERARKIVP